MHREPFVKLSPVFKDYLWGGEKLKALYSVTGNIVAEAWLLSAHPDGPSVVAEGQYVGMPFPEYLKQQEDVRDGFPVLVKLIDSAQKLSVQVHPDNEYARIHENDNGKSELWMVLEADENAYLYVGFNRDVSQQELRQRIQDGTVEEVLYQIQTSPGDMIYIPAGTVHAIGEGNLILEVQQSSNATYRLYDYNRRDAKGNLRPLHIDKALDVADLSKAASAGPAQQLASMECEYFSVERLTVKQSLTLPMTDDRFAAVVCTDGEGALKRQGRTTHLRRGDSVYLPAGKAPAEFTGGMALAVIRANI